MGQDAEHPAGGRRDMAVAIACDDDEDGERIPRVVARGHGLLARQIVALAFENGIKVREDADLVGVLAAVDEDSAIPSEAVMAVAEILSYLYRANGGLRTGGRDDHVTNES